MCFAISQSFLLIMPGAKKGLFTLGADKVFDVPLLPEGVDDSVLDWTPTSTANRNAHLIVTTKTEKIAIFFPGLRIQLYFAIEAVKMVWVVDFAFKSENWFIDDGVTAMAETSP